MAKTVPSFGQLFKAATAGFKWVPEFRLFVRITPIGEFFQVELQPPTYQPYLRVSGSTSAPAPAWHSQEGILECAPVFNKYMGRSKPHTFYMDEDGMELPAQHVDKLTPESKIGWNEPKAAIQPEGAPEALVMPSESEGIPREFKGSK